MPFLCAIFLGLALPACSKEISPNELQVQRHSHSRLLKEASLLIKTSNDSKELADALIALFQSESTKDFGAALKFLEDSHSVNRLDSKDTISSRLISDFQISRVLRVIAKLSPEKANEAFLTLRRSNAFTYSPLRLDALIQACEEIRAPTERLLDFLQSQENTTPILIRMHAEAACKRIEKQFFSGNYDDKTKKDWFARGMFRVRNELPIVLLYKSILSADIKDSSLREIVVQTLFDYRPFEWFPAYFTHSHMEVLPKAPSRMAASIEVLEEMREVADLSLKLDISAETKTTVKKARQEIETILAFHHSGGPKLIAKHIAELDSERYPIRDKATRELEHYGKWAEAPLRKALEGQISQETRARAEAILAKLKK